MNPQLLALAVQELPALIATIKTLFVQQHPAVPEPTDDEIIAGLQSALLSSLARDAEWLSVHKGED